MAANKPSTAQIALIHSVESLGISSLGTIIIGIGQYLSVHGLNLPGLAATAGALFLGAMGMLYKSVASNPNTMVALQDTEKQVAPVVQRVENALPPVVQVDAQKLASEVLGHLNLSQLALLLKNELMKPVAPVRPQGYPPVQELPTRPMDAVQPVRQNTPPISGTALQQLGQLAQPTPAGMIQPNADWMNQQPPNRAG